MFDPLTIGVGVLIWSAFKKSSNTQFGVVTPEREEIYKNAMAYGKDPAKLVQLAADFEKFGLKPQALTLRARAKWRSRTPEAQRMHDEIFVKALQSDKPEAILEVAKVFHGMTATIKASQLRERAKSLLDAERNKVENPISDSMSGHTAEKKENEHGLPQDSAAAE